MSSSPENFAPAAPAPKPKRSPLVWVAGIGGCLLLCICVVIAGLGWFYFAGPGQTAPIISGLLGTPTRPAGFASTRVPTGSTPSAKATATRSASQPGTTPPASTASLKTFTGSPAPFTIKYPADWDVEDDQQDSQAVLFTSPDNDAQLFVAFAKATSGTADATLTTMLGDLLIAEDTPIIVSKKTNADGSITAEIKFTDAFLGEDVRGYARVVKTKDYAYLVIFDTLQDQFDQKKDQGNTLLNSFSAK